MRLVLIVLLTLVCAPARSGDLVIAGAEEVVFDWDRDRCATWDIPDGPARAWRGVDGTVHLLAASEQTRASRGPTLDDQTRDCRILYAGRERNDPAAFDDRSWLASPYLEPSGRLVALAHVEFHGHLRPDMCLAKTYAACWWNTIVEFGADGAGFQPRGLVASLPAPYRPDQRHRQGYFNPSNIIAVEDYLYAFVFAEDSGAQRRGACLIRRSVESGPADWRAWNGTGFNTRFADPYRDMVSDPTAHVCAPLPGLVSTMSSVLRLPDGGFLGLTPATLRDRDGVRQSGIWWTTSPDLLHWRRPQLLLPLPLLWRRDCGQEAAYAYPAILDPDSPSANFDTLAGAAWLYLVRLRIDAACQTGPDRDLIRIPVNWRGRSAE